MSKEKIAKLEEYINRHSKPQDKTGEDICIGMFAGALAALDIMGYKVEMVGGAWKVIAK